MPVDTAEGWDDEGVSNFAEYQEGGTDPTDYYNGDLPVADASGNYQTGEPGTFSAEPFVVKLTRGSDPTDPWVDGPITAEVLNPPGVSPGQISDTNTGTGLDTTLSLRTDSEGLVRVYFRHPDGIPPAPVVRAVHFKFGSAVPSGSSTVLYFSVTTREFYPYPPNTVGRSAVNAIDSRLAASTAAMVNPETAKLVFTTQDHDTPTYVRNTASWCYDLRQPMTCISPWNVSVKRSAY